MLLEKLHFSFFLSFSNLQSSAKLLRTAFGSSLRPLARSHKESFQSEPLLEVSRSNRSIQCAATCRSRRWSDKRVLVELRLDEARKQDLKKPTRSARNSFLNCRNS